MLYFLVYVVAQSLGYYALTLNPKRTENRLIFAFSTSVCFWALGLTVSIFARDVETATRWGYVCSLGWVSFFAFLLHYTLVFTKNDFLKGKRYLLYIAPTVVLLLILFFGSADVIMVDTPYGYHSNVYEYYQNFTIADYAHRLYYIPYLMYCVFLLFRNTRTSKSNKDSIISNHLSRGILISFVVGELLNNSRLLFPMIPKLSVLSVLISVGFIFYDMKKLHYLLPEESIGSKLEEEEIRGDKQTHIFLFISRYLLIIGNVTFVPLFYFVRESPTKSLLLSSVFLGIAVIVYIVTISKLPPIWKERINLTFICSSIFYFIFMLESMRYITIGAFGFTLILLSVVLNNPKATLILGVTTFIAQVTISLKNYGELVHINESDTGMRLVFTVIILVVSIYVKNIIYNRLVQNEHRINFKKVISGMMSSFSLSEDKNMDNLIERILEESGRYLMADRSYIVMFTQGSTDQLHSVMHWYRKGLSDMDEVVISDKVFDIIGDEEYVFVKDKYHEAQLSDSMIDEVFGQGVRSALTVPIYQDQKVVGALCYDSTRKLVDISRDMVLTLGNIVTNAYARAYAETTLFRTAYFDSTTKLTNRDYFNSILDRDLLNADDFKDRTISIAFIDIDSFKQINEAIGRENGDELLAMVGERLKSLEIDAKVVSRFSGDEFIIYMNTQKDVDRIAQNIMTSFEKPFEVLGSPITLQVSMGIAIYPQDGETTRELLKSADIAMYEAKHQGKSRYVIQTSSIVDSFAEQISLTNALHRSRDNNELELYYQPQISTRTGKITGVEALIRWNHPEKGLVSPGVFIPLAEQTGLITNIGEWVIDRACAQAKLWQEQYGVNLLVAVNVSTRQLREIGFSNFIRDSLRRTGLNPQQLEIEITESNTLESHPMIMHTFNDIKRLGVKIAIDDFGTRYSSLGRLRYMPVDKLKIDMMFVRGLSTNQVYRGVTKSIINFAKNLGMTVLAEGVETAEQRDFLRENGCDEIQGYFYYKPMKASDFEELLKSDMFVSTAAGGDQ